MFRFTKARSPDETLSDLENFLRGNSDEPIEFLSRMVDDWRKISYEDLEAAIAAGKLDELIDWRNRYAKVVNEKFSPLWLLAIQTAASKATRGRITIDDSDFRVKDFLRTRGAELVTLLSDESKRAIAAIILHGQANMIPPKKIAQQIRPLIGLNARQAQANVNYRERIFNRLVEQGLPANAANSRADKAALKYASKQHRQRAETIVHTELARAYNQGAHEGILAAQRAGLMGVCEMVWSTAGTNRVCGRCLALKDTVVGHTNESGVTLPPLHPRCRCTIIYREVGKPLTAPATSGNVGGRGLAAGNINVITTEGSPPKVIDKLESLTPVAIQKTLEHYEAQIVKAPVEHAVIITATGEIWHCNGDIHGIPNRYFKQLAAQLEGAHVTHNHPPNAYENDHTFSNDDISNFEYFKMARLRGIDEKFVYELNRNPNDLDFEELTAGELLEMLSGEFKDSHRLVGLTAKNSEFGYRRWSR